MPEIISKIKEEVISESKIKEPKKLEETKPKVEEKKEQENGQELDTNVLSAQTSMFARNVRLKVPMLILSWKLSIFIKHQSRFLLLLMIKMNH